MLFELLKFVSFGEFPSHLWPPVTKKMGGDDSGFTADVVS